MNRMEYILHRELARFVEPLLSLQNDPTGERRQWFLAQAELQDTPRLLEGAMGLVSAAEALISELIEYSDRVSLDTAVTLTRELGKLGKLNGIPGGAVLKVLLGLWLVRYHSTTLRVLELAGVATPAEERRPFLPEGASIPWQRLAPELELKKLGALFSDPIGLLASTYGAGIWRSEHWLENAPRLGLLLSRVRRLLNDLGVEAVYGGDVLRPHGASFPGSLHLSLSPWEVADFGLGMQFVLATAEEGASPAVWLVLAPEGRLDWHYEHGPFSLETMVTASTSFGFRPDGLDVPDGEDINASASIHLSIDQGSDVEGEPTLLLGRKEGTYLSIERWHAAVRGMVDIADGESHWDFGASLGVEGCRLKLLPPKEDGFLSAVLPDSGISGDFSLHALWSLRKGLELEGAAGLSTTIPLKQTLLGIITVQSLWLSAEASISEVSWKIPLELGLSFSTKLGPLTATVDRVGTSITADSRGLRAGFLPPTGVGLVVDNLAVTGGGFLAFSPDEGRYDGALELRLADLCDVTAIASLETRLPPGQGDFSFMALLNAAFPGPGLQLGLGFTLLGVGGMLGINRRLDLDALRKLFLERRAHELLFPRDVVRNAPALIRDLRAVFPAEPGSHVLGPMLKLGWGTPTIFTLALGVFIEIPSFERVALLGELACLIPDPAAPLVKIQVDVLGWIDFGARKAGIDGSLRDSRILILELSGDMAFRLRWGDDPGFAFSIGGFHPSYVPPAALELPPMQRLRSSLGFSGGGVSASITRELYFAITSNTLQFGARDQLRVTVPGGGAEGGYGFDALIEFSPFGFVASLEARLRVWAAGVTIGALSVRGEISGPNPWRIAGKARISVLFVDVTVRFDVCFGEKKEERALPDTDLLGELKALLASPEQWSPATGQRSKSVILRERREPGSVHRVAPDIPLSFRQKKLPLETEMTRYAQRALPRPSRLDIVGVAFGILDSSADDHLFHTGDDPAWELELFAPAQHRELNIDEKLAAPSFERCRAGFTLEPASGTLIPDEDLEVQLESETILVEVSSEDPFRRISSRLGSHPSAAAVLDRNSRMLQSSRQRATKVRRPVV